MGGSPQVCTWCGHEMRHQARFCAGCGRAAQNDRNVALPGKRAAAPSGATTVSARYEPGRKPASPALAGPPGPNEARRSRSRWPVILGLAVFLTAAGTVATVLVLHSSHGSRAAASRHGVIKPIATHGSPTSATSTSTSPSSSPPSQQQAADSLAGLLANSVADRSSIVPAVQDVNQCGPDLSQDPETFQNAATSRQSLISQLADLPGRSTLPAQMLQNLASAWQASVQADQDFAQWAQDEVSQGCVQNDHSDPNYQAAGVPDSEATTAKKAFVGFWDPIASEYGLPSYQWNQL
jgi:hypothetical protein